ncbi:hypothetical protein HMPREF0973_02609 [Prevotella veroralis F0319]|uniref:Uncharacterized protein n=1 Tax=Prevotella veroralis F0319 TaxID=649761 RepID=C9MSJ0_9BACT|nr:hypothetical protein HMPREF0973_02609 [Prevotella veroralis F0319]
MPNGSKLGEAYINSKRAFLRCEETPFSWQGNALFNAKGTFLYLKNIPTCRDRRPRLSARALPIKSLPKPLQRRGCCLTGCHERVNERTDGGVCPYCVAFILIKVDSRYYLKNGLLTVPL